MSKKFLNANGFYKYCKSAPKLGVTSPNKQLISMDKILCPTVFTIDGNEFIGLQFRVLRHAKNTNIIMGLPTLRELDVTIHPSSNEFIVRNTTVTWNREPIRKSCLLVALSKMDKIHIKQSRHKKNPSDIFLIS